MNKVSTIMTWIDVKIINKKSNPSLYPSPPKKQKKKKKESQIKKQSTWFILGMLSLRCWMNNVGFSRKLWRDTWAEDIETNYEMYESELSIYYVLGFGLDWE